MKMGCTSETIFAEFGGYALGQMRGDAAADPDDLDVPGVRAKLLEEVLQSAVAQHHRVAAAHNDVSDLRVLASTERRTYW